MNNVNNVTTKTYDSMENVEEAVLDSYDKISECIKNTNEKVHREIRTMCNEYEERYRLLRQIYWEMFRGSVCTLIVLFLSCGLNFVHPQKSAFIQIDKDVIYQEQTITWEWTKFRDDSHILLDNMFDVTELIGEATKQAFSGLTEIVSKN